MARDFRRLHWRWLAMCAITATMAGCAPVPVAESDVESGALMAGNEPLSEAAPPAVPSAGKRAARTPRAAAPEARATEQAPAAEAQAPSSPNPEFALVPSRDSDQQGLASWYGPGLHGRLTASGERFDKEELTAAHRSFAFGSRVCVRSGATGKTVVVRINDRGPFAPGRVIDLSQAAAQELGMVGLGIKPVELWQLDEGEQECPETLVTAKKADAIKKTQQAKAQAQARPRMQAKAPAPARTRVQAKAPTPKARTAVASSTPAKPAAPAATPAAGVASTAVASAAQEGR